MILVAVEFIRDIKGAYLIDFVITQKNKGPFNLYSE